MKPAYTPYHPRWHRERLPIFWWLGRLAYARFIARELTSLAVVYTAAVLAAWVGVLARGPEAYVNLVDLLRSPPLLLLNALAFLGLLFHSVTWLNLAPRALAARIGGRRVPDAAVLAGHYAAWAVASGLVFWMLTGR